MKAAVTALAAFMAISTCMTAMAAPRQETGYYTSERREGLKTYKSQKRFNWMTENNQIIFSTVCMNERSGSIEYRECRKRAKEYFKRKCNVSDDRFCHASRNFNPL
ncbi:hypothetical protein [Ectopseudomonas alcaliphila]|uniref:Uncharacterized protein n=1 Tax=Ectopseudomonas alcaliphila TaxID=101564 RepID=A0ABU4PYK3_9GAMM|nr:hypothetical protein [Pseudomonas alcaliphila]MDX5991740.1 hypothetical protein [Pseudomonas alcaliphila]